MSHQRRILNLVLKNNVTGVHSLHRLNPFSPLNNLFYPTAKSAEDAAAAKDPELLFASADDAADVFFSSHYERKNGEESLAKTKPIRLPPPMMSFEPTPDPRYDTLYNRLDCAALSEARTVFVDRHSHAAAFLYDADKRRVVTMAPLVERPQSYFHPWRRIYFPIAAAAGDDEGNDTVYAMDRAVEEDQGKGFQFQAMVHRKLLRRSRYRKRWHVDELPRPPYVDDDGNRGAKTIVSYALVGGAAAADVIWVSTVGRGIYCFDTASRVWSKAGDWALPFDGKVERDRDLGIWLGFVKHDSEEGGHSLFASGDLFNCGVERGSEWKVYHRDGWRDLVAPWGWHSEKAPEPQVVSLGSGKFCVTQFFETMGEPCSKCLHDEDADKSFAVFTGVEVVRCHGGDVGDEQAGGDGRAITIEPTKLRVIIHKSKRYMLNKGNTIEFVL